MLTLITSFLITTVGTTAAGAFVAWLLGRFSGAKWYQKLRDKAGRQAYRIGVVLSRLGNGRVGSALMEPLEDAFVDWAQFLLEQLAVGLRADNLRKMEKQLDRLEGVGSVTRADALKEKIAVLAETPKPLQDIQEAAMMARLRVLGDSSVSEKLME